MRDKTLSDGNSDWKVGRLGRTSSVARDRIPSAGRRKKQTDSTLVRSSYRVRPSTR